MDNKTFHNVIAFIRPNAVYVARGNKLEWLDENQTEPTEEEIEAGLIPYQKAVAAEAEAKIQAKATAQAKLAALGLTIEDLTALGL